MIRHYISHRLILNAGYVVSPFKKGLESTELSFGLQGAISSNDHVVVVIFNNGFLIGFQS